MKFNQVALASFLLVGCLKLHAVDTKGEVLKLWHQYTHKCIDGIYLEGAVGLASMIEFVRIDNFSDNNKALQSSVQACCQFNVFCEVGRLIALKKEATHDWSLKQALGELDAYVQDIRLNHAPRGELQYAALLTALHDKSSRIVAPHANGAGSEGILWNIARVKQDQAMQDFKTSLGNALAENFPGFTSNLVEIEGLPGKEPVYVAMRNDLNADVELMLNQFEGRESGRSNGNEQAAEYRFILNITKAPKPIYGFSQIVKYELQGFLTGKIIRGGISESISSEVDVYKYYVGKGFKESKNEGLFDFISKVIFEQTSWRKKLIPARAAGGESQERLFSETSSMDVHVNSAAAVQEDDRVKPPKSQIEELQEDEYFTFLPGKGPARAKK